MEQLAVGYQLLAKEKIPPPTSPKFRNLGEENDWLSFAASIAKNADTGLLLAQGGDCFGRKVRSLAMTERLIGFR